MKKLDKELTINCEICDRSYTIRVSSDDYEVFKDPTNTEFVEILFPYLSADEVYLLATGICSNCE